MEHKFQVKLVKNILMLQFRMFRCKRYDYESILFLGACGNGHVIFAHIIERRIEWRDYEATVTGKLFAEINCILVKFTESC